MGKKRLRKDKTRRKFGCDRVTSCCNRSGLKARKGSTSCARATGTGGQNQTVTQSRRIWLSLEGCHQSRKANLFQGQGGSTFIAGYNWGFYSSKRNQPLLAVLSVFTLNIKKCTSPWLATTPSASPAATIPASHHIAKGTLELEKPFLLFREIPGTRPARKRPPGNCRALGSRIFSLFSDHHNYQHIISTEWRLSGKSSIFVVFERVPCPTGRIQPPTGEGRRGKARQTVFGYVFIVDHCHKEYSR